MGRHSSAEVVKLAQSWVGKNEKDGSYREIIDIYNSLGVQNLPRKMKMQYSWSWCAATWSALAIKLGYTDIMPIEISCGNLQKIAAGMGIWEENDSYIPEPGDAVLYDWDDNKNYATTDDHGWPDHIGVVEAVFPDTGYMIVIEGNYNDAVKRRTLYVNGRYIRGFITPKYDDAAAITPIIVEGKTIDGVAHDVIAGVYGNQPQREIRVAEAGYNYSEVRDRVNEILNGSVKPPKTEEQDQTQPVQKRVLCNGYAKTLDKSKAGTYITTTNLYCRDAAGSNKKALCIIPKGTSVRNYGYLNYGNPYNWLLIEVTIDGVQYVGFCYDQYLKKK